jgi:hypothetical protein
MNENIVKPRTEHCRYSINIFPSLPSSCLLIGIAKYQDNRKKRVLWNGLSDSLIYEQVSTLVSENEFDQYKENKSLRNISFS